MVAQVKAEQNKLLSLESEAENTLKEFESLKKEYEKSLNKMNEYAKVDTTTLDEAKFEALVKQTGDLTNLLNNLERKISTVGMRVNQILQQFDAAKKNIIISRNKHKEAKEKLDAVKSNLEPQIMSIQKEMAEVEKTVDPKIMAKYKHIRQDNIFPVFVPLTNLPSGYALVTGSLVVIRKIKSVLLIKPFTTMLDAVLDLNGNMLVCRMREILRNNNHIANSGNSSSVVINLLRGTKKFI